MKNPLPSSICSLFLLLCGLPCAVLAQTLIQGKVTAENGEELPGVSIVLKGTQRGTTSDAAGNYSLNVPDGDATLTASFIGYVTQELAIANRKTVDFKLVADVKSLNEVVVTGYTTQSRATVTSSIARLDTREIQAVPSVNPLQSLQGKLAGVSVPIASGQPGQPITLVIRGGTGTNPYGTGAGGGRESVAGNPADSNPLYVVDGVFRTDINDLNANDIESITVLKDAASTSIYGSRAANGVLIVKTKTGSFGSGPGRLTFSYNHNVESLRKNYDFANARDYLITARASVARGIIDPAQVTNRLTNGTQMYSTNTVTTPGQYGQLRYTPIFVDDLARVEGQPYVDDLLNNQGYETLTDPVTGRTILFKDNNYQDVIWNTAHTNNYNLGFSGGSDRATFNVGLGYIDQGGIYLGTNYKRWSFLSNVGYKIKPNVRVDVGFSYQGNNNQYVASYVDLTRSVRVPNTFRLYYEGGLPGIGENAGSPRNRLNELYYQDRKALTGRATARMGVDWELLPGLHFRPSGSYYREDFNENFFQKSLPQNTNRDVYHYQRIRDQLMADGLLTYEKSFGLHNVNALVGGNYTRNTFYDINAYGAQAATDYLNSVAAAARALQGINANNVNDDRILSGYGQINYNYNGKYLFSLSSRYDGSSRFAASNRYALFPGVSGGWNVHKENFWSVSAVSTLKLRASWGKTGLNALQYVDTQGEYGVGNNYAGGAGVLNTRLANPDLVWETTATTDAGLDLGLVNNRLNLSVDYYNKLTSNRLFDQPLPLESGFSSIRANVGGLRNRGVEVALGGTVLKRGDFTWDANFTFAFNRGIVTKLPTNGRVLNRINGTSVADGNGGYTDIGGLAEGERYGGLWAFQLDGVYATDEEAAKAPTDLGVSGNQLGKLKRGGDARWRDVDNNGRIDTRDLVFQGYRTPDRIGGLVNNLTFKRLTLRFVVDYALGHVIADGPLARGMANGRNNESMPSLALRSETWQKAGDVAQYPRYDAVSDYDRGYRNHLRFLENYGVAGVGQGDGYAADVSQYYAKGDFLAFREVSLSYQLNPVLLKRLGLSNLALNAGVYNLGYITKYTGLSPEIYTGGDYGSYPRPRQLSFGASVSF